MNIDAGYLLTHAWANLSFLLLWGAVCWYGVKIWNTSKRIDKIRADIRKIENERR